jgi:acyl carrier protein
MKQEQALSMILGALETAVPGSSSKVTMESHLVADGIIDSLDLMAFLYELERDCGDSLEVINDDFNDYRVVRLVEILQKL